VTPQPLRTVVVAAAPSIVAGESAVETELRLRLGNMQLQVAESARLHSQEQGRVHELEQELQTLRAARGLKKAPLPFHCRF
jgi:hypothetical protein